MMVSLVISFSLINHLSLIYQDLHSVVVLDANFLVDVDSDLVLVSMVSELATHGPRLATTLNSPLLTPLMTSRSSPSLTTLLRNTRLLRRYQK